MASRFARRGYRQVRHLADEPRDVIIGTCSAFRKVKIDREGGIRTRPLSARLISGPFQPRAANATRVEIG
jgi:hypothetical protein